MEGVAAASLLTHNPWLNGPQNRSPFSAVEQLHPRPEVLSFDLPNDMDISNLRLWLRYFGAHLLPPATSHNYWYNRRPPINELFLLGLVASLLLERARSERGHSWTDASYPCDLSYACEDQPRSYEQPIPVPFLLRQLLALG